MSCGSVISQMKTSGNQTWRTSALATYAKKTKPPSSIKTFTLLITGAKAACGGLFFHLDHISNIRQHVKCGPGGGVGEVEEFRGSAEPCEGRGRREKLGVNRLPPGYCHGSEWLMGSETRAGDCPVMAAEPWVCLTLHKSWSVNERGRAFSVI